MTDFFPAVLMSDGDLLSMPTFVMHATSFEPQCGCMRTKDNENLYTGLQNMSHII